LCLRDPFIYEFGSGAIAFLDARILIVIFALGNFNAGRVENGGIAENSWKSWKY